MAFSRKCLSFFLILFHHGLCQRMPTISYITQDQIRDIGDKVEFECSVQHAAEDSYVLWVKDTRNRTDDTFPLSMGSALIVRDKRFTVRVDQVSDTTNFKLQIDDIQEIDDAGYECQVIISVLKKVTARTELRIRRSPIISDKYNSLFVNEVDN